MTGARQIDRYEVLEELGRGGMAVVYLARQRDLDRYVALKELSAFHRTDAAWTARFLRESRLAGSLAHANIVTVHDYLQADGTPYIAMEYLRRGSLRPFVGALTTAQIGGALADVLAGLEHAEKRGIVHRDLKPENLLVTEEGRVKITDFGIAKATTNASFQTQSGIAVGTPAYMAPEQALAGTVGPWSDLYSVGCMAYELFVGRLPFMSPEPMALMFRHINEPAEPAAQANPELDPRLAAWVDSLLVKEPEKRPSAAAEAWETLEETLLELLGPRWRRASALPELTVAHTAEPRAAFMSSILDSSAFVDFQPERRSASLLTPPPAPGGPPSIPDALPGPYTPPPDAPVPASLVDAARALSSDALDSAEAPAPPMPSDALLPVTDDAFITFEPWPERPGEAAGPTPTPAPAPAVTAPPVAAPTEAEPASRRRRGPLVAAAATGLVAAAAVAGVLLLGAGEDPAPPPAAQAARGPVASPQPLAAGDVRVTIPGDWRPGHAVPGALAFTEDVAGATAPEGGGVVAGMVPAKAVGASLLATKATTDAEPVQLGSLSAYRYADVPLPGGAATVYAVPTGAGVATVACLELDDAVCQSVAQSLTVSGATVYPVGPSDDYARAVRRAVNDLDSATATLRRAALPAKQAQAAAGVERRFDRVAARLRALTLSPADAALNRSLVTAIAGAADQYGDVARAARRNQRVTYRREGAAVRRARSAVDRALATLTAAGYETLGRLGRASVPALKRPPRKPAAPSTPGSRQAGPTATATAAPQQQQQQPVRPQPTAVRPKPTPIPPKPTPIPIDG